MSPVSVLDQILNEMHAVERDDPRGKDMRVAYVYMTPACYNEVRAAIAPAHGWQLDHRGELSVGGVPFLVQGFERSQWNEVRFKVSLEPMKRGAA